MTLASLAGGPVQLAYGVDDVRSATIEWVGRGAGPFFVRDHIEVGDVKLDGAPGSFDHSSAYGQWGALMVELVVVHDPPHLARRGLHHQAFFVDSFAEASGELVDVGWRCAMAATAGSTRFAFHDATADLGHFVEIYEDSDPLRGFYEMVREAAHDWDGREPVRLLG